MKHKLEPNTSKIAFIGSGNMSKAIIGGLLSQQYQKKHIIASNPTKPKLNQLAQEYGILTTQDNQQAVEFADIVVLSVKPQIIPAALSGLVQCDFSDKLIISVAAGFKTDAIAQQLDQSLAIIRAMPNTPALISAGATGLFATDQVNGLQKQLAESIFQSVGKTVWIDDESKMDIVTAISGSGPAYFLLMMQHMLEQAIDSGLSENQARDLIVQTAKGTALLAQNNSEQSLSKICAAVTSPGGTTAAAIDSLLKHRFDDIIKQAVNAAIRRGQELGQS